jgi:hypothetical protein
LTYPQHPHEQRLAAIEQRHRLLEQAIFRPAAPPPPAPHEPRPGTWDAHAQTAECRYCGHPVSGGTDSVHGWQDEAGADRCEARANGAEAAS